MLRSAYDWCIAAAHKPYALWLMGLVAFLESSVFPVPPDAMLIPMSLARPEKAWSYAAICTVTSVAGGVLGYFIGAFLYDSVGHWLISLYGYGDKVEAFREAYARWGTWIILLKGVTPIPYKIVTITSGFAGYSLALFIVLFHHGARHAVLPRRIPAQPLRSAGPRNHRKAPGLLVRDQRGRAARRDHRRGLPVLTGRSDRPRHRGAAISSH